MMATRACTPLPVLPGGSLQLLFTAVLCAHQRAGLLTDRWEQAREGMGQVVLLIGEAGLGKLRLVHTMKQHVL